MHDSETKPAKFLPTYRDEDGWYRFNILMTDGALYRSGEYAHEANAERDRAYCRSKNSVDDIETMEIEQRGLVSRPENPAP